MKEISNINDLKEVSVDDILISAPYSVYYLGLEYLYLLIKGKEVNFIVNCHDDCALAYKALKMGFTKVMIERKNELSQRLEIMATSLGSEIVYENETC